MKPELCAYKSEYMNVELYDGTEPLVRVKIFPDRRECLLTFHEAHKLMDGLQRIFQEQFPHSGRKYPLGAVDKVEK